MLKINNINPSRNLFTFTDSSWDDDYDMSRSTGGYLIFYQGGVVKHSSNMPIPVAMSSAEAECNEACLACVAIGNLHMTLNHIEGIKEGSKENLPVYFFMDNKSAVDMSVTFKDTKNACHIQRRFNFVKQGTEQNWHKLTCIINQYMVADVTIKILARKPMEDQTQWFMTPGVPE